MTGPLTLLTYLLYLLGPLAIGWSVQLACQRWEATLRRGTAILVASVVWLVPACFVLAGGGEGGLILGSLAVMGSGMLLLFGVVLVVMGLVRGGNARRARGSVLPPSP